MGMARKSSVTAIDDIQGLVGVELQQMIPIYSGRSKGDSGALSRSIEALTERGSVAKKRRDGENVL